MRSLLMGTAVAPCSYYLEAAPTPPSSLTSASTQAPLTGGFSAGTRRHRRRASQTSITFQLVGGGAQLDHRVGRRTCSPATVDGTHHELRGRFCRSRRPMAGGGDIVGDRSGSCEYVRPLNCQALAGRRSSMRGTTMLSLRASAAAPRDMAATSLPAARPHRGRRTARTGRSLWRPAGLAPLAQSRV